MGQENRFDLVVLGAGPGGYVAAIQAAKLGMRTAVVEKDKVGGTCLNRGCIPTKTLMHTAHAYYEALHMDEMGLCMDNLSLDPKKLQGRKEQVMAQLREGISGLLKANQVEVYEGTAAVARANQVTVVDNAGEEIHLQTEKILVATGSRPSMPPIEGIMDCGALTSDELLGQDFTMYDSLLIVGGGVIGVEFGTIYADLGCKVEIVEAMDRILPGMDKELSQSAAMNLKKRGVKIHTGSMVTKLEKTPEGVACHFTEKGKEMTASSQAVLISIGRKPNTEGLFAPEATPEMERGFLKVDEDFATSIPGIYAIGDVTGGIMLAHMASAQALAAVRKMAGQPAAMDLSVVPSCIYTAPEIACAGLTEAEAKARGMETLCGKYSMLGNGKTIIAGGERGFIKVVLNAGTHQIVGAQMLCDRATDMIGELSSAMVNGLTAEALLRVIRPHPTYGEAVTEALEDAIGEAIHVMPKKRR